MNTFGPPLPPSFTSSQPNVDEGEDFSIGPTPPGTSAPRRHYEKPSFSKDTDDSNKRDEWMLSLPDMKKKTQLSHLQGSLPTTFRKNGIAPQDDSWTKNPNEPESHSPKKKKKRTTSDRDDFDEAYDREQEKAAKSSKKDRERDKKSLLELHKAKLKKEKKKLKKERKERDEKPERMPFSRDTDLSWNSNDSKKKSKAISNMTQPDSRFHSGSRKYL